MDVSRRIAAVDEIPEEGTLLFTIRNGFDREEVILVRTGDGVRAWKNYCQHWTDVRLDKGGGATVRNGELLCGKHGAMFEKDSGVCTFGPCEGAVLESVDVAVREGDVYLAEADYEFEKLGPSGDHDLSANRSLGFD